MIPWWTWISIICQYKLRHCYKSARRCLISGHSKSISHRQTVMLHGIGIYAALDLFWQDWWCIQRFLHCIWMGFNNVSFDSFDFEMSNWPEVSCTPWIRNCQMIWSLSVHHSLNSTHAILPKSGQPWNVQCCLSCGFISVWSQIVLIENTTEIQL